MDLETVILREVRQRRANVIWYSLYVESKKNGTNDLIYKTEIELQMLKQSYGYKRKREEE